MACAEYLRVQAYFDGEVDAISASEIEEHAENCTECRAQLRDLGRLRTAICREATHVRAPSELHARITRALDAESALEAPPPVRRSRSGWRVRPFWLGAFGGIGGTAIAAVLAFVFLLPLPGDRLLDDLVDAHVRSLMPSHLIDVASTDQHTVKPWFAGRTDVSPVVADFAQQGYRLVGGRADYLERQRSAVVVYQHGSHVINVFSWPAHRRVSPKNAVRSGYRMAFWQAGDVQYCAVSDTGWDELRGLVRLLKDATDHDVPK